MLNLNLDLKKGQILINSAVLKIGSEVMLDGTMAKLCARPLKDNARSPRYQLLEKVILYGIPAECVIEVSNQKVQSAVLLFDFIDFFKSSILESKIVISCEKSSGISFKNDHPSTAFLDFEWGRAEFFYDARQGDLSFNMISKEQPGREA